MKSIAPDLWHQRLLFVKDRIEDGSDADIERSLRHMFHLSQIAPGPFIHLARPRIEENILELFLDKGNYEAAALGLVSDLAICRVSYDCKLDSYSAAIALPILSLAVEAATKSPATATLSSWVKCFIAIYATYGRNSVAIIESDPHIYKLEPLPPRTEH